MVERPRVTYKLNGEWPNNTEKPEVKVVDVIQEENGNLVITLEFEEKDSG